MKRPFDLLSEPFIPVVIDGGIQELGIRETLRLAGRIDALAVVAPPHFIGVLGVLVAIVQRACPPRNDEQWLRNVQSGWDQSKVDAYLDDVSDRFDLLSQELPFLQVTALDDGAKEVSAAKLTMLHAAGDMKRLMDHSSDDDPTPFPLDEISIAMIGAHACAPGGGQSTPCAYADGTRARGVTTIAAGRTLRETIAMALLTPDIAGRIRSPKATGPDLPSWEREMPSATPTKEDLTRPLTGYVDWLTLTSRRVQLVAEEIDGRLVVRRVRLRPGYRPDGDEDADRIEPWSRAEAKAVNRLRPPPWPLWMTALSAVSRGEKGRLPLVLEQVQRAHPRVDEFALHVAGSYIDGTFQVRFMANDQVVIPGGALWGDSAHEAVDAAEKLVKRAKLKMKDVAVQVLNSGRNDTREWWGRMEPSTGEAEAWLWAEAHEAVMRLAASGVSDEWKSESARLAFAAAEQYSKRFGNSARAIIGVAKAIGRPQ